uniref:Uncharacterized protein n=1 Tax=Anguilla anguilla TaxID=7936 RepID=A0A0E9VIS9_ANGAN
MMGPVSLFCCIVIVLFEPVATIFIIFRLPSENTFRF